MNRTFNISKLAIQASAIFLTALILFALAIEASPSLHKLIHADANSASHNCAVTLFAKGQITSAAPTAVQADFVPQFFTVSLFEKVVTHAAIDVRLDPGRAPPRA